MEILYKSKNEINKIKEKQNVFELKNNWNIGANITECVKRNKKDLRIIIRDKHNKKCDGRILYLTFYNVNKFLKESKINSIILRKSFFKNLENEVSKDVVINTLKSVLEYENERMVYIEK